MMKNLDWLLTFPEKKNNNNNNKQQKMGIAGSDGCTHSKSFSWGWNAKSTYNVNSLNNLYSNDSRIFET